MEAAAAKDAERRWKEDEARESAKAQYAEQQAMEAAAAAGKLALGLAAISESPEQDAATMSGTGGQLPIRVKLRKERPRKLEKTLSTVHRSRHEASLRVTERRLKEQEAREAAAAREEEAKRRNAEINEKMKDYHSEAARRAAKLVARQKREVALRKKMEEDEVAKRKAKLQDFLSRQEKEVPDEKEIERQRQTRARLMLFEEKKRRMEELEERRLEAAVRMYEQEKYMPRTRRTGSGTGDRRDAGNSRLRRRSADSADRWRRSKDNAGFIESQSSPDHHHRDNQESDAWQHGEDDFDDDDLVQEIEHSHTRSGPWPQRLPAMERSGAEAEHQGGTVGNALSPEIGAETKRGVELEPGADAGGTSGPDEAASTTSSGQKKGHAGTAKRKKKRKPRFRKLKPIAIPEYVPVPKNEDWGHIHT